MNGYHGPPYVRDLFGPALPNINRRKTASSSPEDVRYTTISGERNAQDAAYALQSVTEFANVVTPVTDQTRGRRSRWSYQEAP